MAVDLIVMHRSCSSGTGVGVAGTGLVGGDDACPLDKRVRQGRLAVIDVRNDGHVTDIVLLVHQAANLIDCKVYLQERVRWMDGCYHSGM